MQPQDNELTQEKRKQEIYNEYLFINAAKTDKMFAFLFGIQWILGIVFALVISPKTWIGEYNQVHIHVYAAIFLGGLIASLPVFLIFRNPGATPNLKVTIKEGLRPASETFSGYAASLKA